jgi:O-antigen/teichoic acid export membrane protein
MAPVTGTSDSPPSAPPAADRATDILDTPEAGPAAIRGATLRVVGYALGVALSVGSAALLFRHLGVQDSGRYVTIVSLVAGAAALSDAGLTVLGMRELTVLRERERSRFMRDLLGLRVVLTGAGILGAIVFAVAAGYGQSLVAGTALAGIGQLAISVQSTLSVSLMTRLRLGWVTAIELIRQAVSVAAIAALVVAGATLVPFLAVPILAGLVILALVVWLVRADIPVVPAFHPGRWKALVRDTIAFSIAAAVGVLYFRAAVVLTSLIASATVTGLFAAAFRVVEVLIAVPQLLVSAAFPIFARSARDDHDRLAYGVQRVFEVCMILGGWIALSLALAAPLAIEIVAGPEFEGSEPVLRIQSVALLAAFASASWGYAMLSLHLYRQALVMALSALAVSAALTLTLVPRWDAEGAAVAVAVGEVYVAVLGGTLVLRHSPRLRPKLGVLPRIGLAAALAALPALIPGIPQVALVAAATVIYFTVLVLLRAIPDELLVEVRRRVRSAPA